MAVAPLVFRARPPRRAAIAFVRLGIVQFHDQAAISGMHTMKSLVDTGTCFERRKQFWGSALDRVQIDVLPMRRSAASVVKNDDRVLDRVTIDIRVHDLS